MWSLCGGRLCLDQVLRPGANRKVGLPFPKYRDISGRKKNLPYLPRQPTTKEIALLSCWTRRVEGKLRSYKPFGSELLPSELTARNPQEPNSVGCANVALLRAGKRAKPFPADLEEPRRARRKGISLAKDEEDNSLPYPSLPCLSLPRYNLPADPPPERLHFLCLQPGRSTSRS